MKHNDSSVELFTVDEVLAFWPKIERMLDQVPHTWKRWTKEEIHSGLVNENIQAWGIGKDNIVLVMFTQVLYYETERVLRLRWICGNGIEEFLPTIEASMMKWAMHQGCSRIEMSDSRGGWSRKLRPFGYKVDYVMLSKDVPQGTVQ